MSLFLCLNKFPLLFKTKIVVCFSLPVVLLFKKTKFLDGAVKFMNKIEFRRSYFIEEGPMGFICIPFQVKINAFERRGMC